MKDRVIHQWRDWVLEYVKEDEYALIHKETQVGRSIVAKNDMDAEDQCQRIIKNAKEAQAPEPPDSVES